MTRKLTPIAVALTGLLLTGTLFASSHREAPMISGMPKVDGTDFYMFHSYEAGRAGYITFIANYNPLQDPAGGPNFFSLDPNAAYDIKIDTNGDGQPDLTFLFHFQNTYRGLTVPVNGVNVQVPLVNIGPFDGTPTGNTANKNLLETYTVNVRRNARNNGVAQPATNLTEGGTTFRKPFDNIGNKSIPNYGAYAASHIARIGIPGCAEGRVFVGQRKEGFQVALGKVFDLLNLNPVGAVNANPSDTAQKNVTSIVLEIPVACARNGGGNIIGAWTTASVNVGGTLTQVSRLSAPLVNEVVIGLADKDKFNGSRPQDDAQFATYVTNPTMPILINALFPSVAAPTQYPRTDLVSAFLTGIQGLNKPPGVVASEMMRLNTNIQPTPMATQNNLGVIGGDTSGFPNGRRPGDDVVDIELRVLMGVLLPANKASAGKLPYTDGALVNASQFLDHFPYMVDPLPGAK